MSNGEFDDNRENREEGSENEWNETEKNKEDEHPQEQTQHIEPSPAKKGGKKWIYVTIFLVAFFIGFFLSAQFTGYFTYAKSPSEIGKEIVDYINTNLVENGGVGLVSVEEESGLYKITTSYLGREIPVYATKDGKFLITINGMIDMTEELPETPQTGEIPKTDKPTVDLFVMSQCPFGVQAETNIKPVVELLGDKIDFNLYFIARKTGDGFSSLHGEEEVNEDLRQVCIMQYYPEKFWDYLECVDKDYRNIGSVWENCAEDVGIDTDIIKTCAEGDEGETLLSDNIAVGNSKGISASPTLLINGVMYSGSRTPEAFKSAICSAFTTEPEECSTVLNSTGGDASGSC